MTPTPQEHISVEAVPAGAAPGADGEDIVISGMSGLYPSSHHIKDFASILYNKINPVTEDRLRWKYTHPEVANHAGAAPDLDRFDAQFFRVHLRLGNQMDAMSRKTLEQAYNAIFDAGINPEQLWGQKIGVFVGICTSETEKSCFYDVKSRSGFGITGCSKAMFANRVSYWLDAKGPSMAIDESCCSSTAALEQAYQSIKRGECEAAVVGGCNLVLHPQSSVLYSRVTQQCPDGKMKCFDTNADGCVKTEAINVLFLQKAKDALRVYAHVVHAKTAFIGLQQGETGPRFGFYRNHDAYVRFLKTFYEEAGIPPSAVEYVEAFGPAELEADKGELDAIDTVLCKERDDPLLVGSVTSNIGYGEAASGISGITKVLLAYHYGKLAANLNCPNPRQDVVALRDGRMRIVTEHERFSRSYTAVNGMSLSGINSHVLLHGHYKPKDLSRYQANIPHLVTISGRQESTVNNILRDLKMRPIDPEELALLHNIHSTNISGHLGRGFIILKTDEDKQTVSLCERAAYFDDARRPLWFVYSGMGSQWAGMGAQLMRIPVFAAAIERCRKALEPKGIDIVHIITTTDKTIFDNILHSFVGIAAVQIGLTDVLRELGLVPDGIIGHSVGELGCAYADGCLTAEEMILSAYSRGLVSLQTEFIRGSMAAIGLGYDKISKLCPPEIEVACHNGPESSTISGPADKMKEFVAELTAKGIFAKEVPCSNIAYHSRYIASAGPGLLKYLTEVIKTPRARSERWVSTSIPESRWNEPLAKTSSAEYHTNNLLNPVLLEETLPHIPQGAVLVEVAPHGLLQAILKRSLPGGCSNIPLTRRDHVDNAYLVLEALGKLYMKGYNPQLQKLYPKVEMPVSTGTPFLSHLIEWAHGERWSMPTYQAAIKKSTAACNYVMSVHDKEHNYLSGNVIRGRTLYPYAATLVSVWDTLAMIMEVPKKQLSVEFRDLHFYSQPVLRDQVLLKLRVSVERGTGSFEVLNGTIKVATGIIVAWDPKDDANYLQRNKNRTTQPPQKMALKSSDIYELLSEREYSYSGDFRTIDCASLSLTEASLIWRDNWVALIDGMFQLNMLRQNHDTVTLPTHIRQMLIDVEEHENTKIVANDKVTYKAEIDDSLLTTRCGGIIVEDIRYRHLPALVEDKMELQAIKGDSNLQTDQPDSVKLSNNITLQSAQVGDLNSLKWVEASELDKSGISVKVHYAGINTTDVMKAKGLISLNNNGDNDYGIDFSGVTQSGQRVMGLVPHGAASSVVRARPELLWPVPAHWSLEDAATVPYAYAHALYCLTIKSSLKVGMSVLIHGGAGALGQAAIAIALAFQCEVFTTVSDMRKKRFLLKLFPELKADHIGNSRNQDFKDLLLSVKPQGCDIIINSGSMKKISPACAGPYGICLDVAQLQEQDEEYQLEMNYLTEERSFSTVDFASIFEPENVDNIKTLNRVMSEGIRKGFIRPLTRVTYGQPDVVKAFRLLAASRHRGRVLLRLQEKTQAEPRLNCNSNNTHVILLDEDMFGLKLAARLVARGARKLLIHYNGNVTAKFQFKLQNWQKLGVQVQVLPKDLNKVNNVVELFNLANKLGPVEGVYGITSEKTILTEAVFANLDTASRNLCPQLRYFTAINLGKSTVGQQTCLSRNQSKLPGTMITLPQLNPHEGNRDALDVLEHALRSSDAVLVAQLANKQRRDLLQQLATLTGITITNDTPVTTTLAELGLTEDDNIQSIITYFKVYYSVDFDEEEVPQLTIETILNVEKTESEFQDVKGLGTFLPYVDPDELLATLDLVLMSTLASGDIINTDEIDTSLTNLCIVPGMEGNHERFRGLCERLKLPALVLQPGLDRPHETVRETAERYTQVLLNRMSFHNTFYLLGYETGVLIALEMASILEDLGLTGTVYFLGCAPDEVQSIIEENISEYNTEELLQNAVVEHMCNLMVKSKTDNLKEALKGAATWPEKVEAGVRAMMGHMPYSAQYARACINAALAHIQSARGCVVPARKLRSQLVLMRAALPCEEEAKQALQKHSQRPVIVHQLSTPLAHVASDIRCASIINQHLDSEILESFEKKNICDGYILKSNITMVIKALGNNTLQDELKESLTHVNDMLADIEDKIKSENTVLTPADYHYKDTPPGFLDYGVTDIFWNSIMPQPATELSSNVTHDPASSHKGALRNQQPDNTFTPDNTIASDPPQIVREPAISDIVAHWASTMESLSDRDMEIGPPTPVTPPTTVIVTFWTPTMPTSSTASTTTTVTTTTPPPTGIPPHLTFPGVPEGWPFSTTPLPRTVFSHNLHHDMTISNTGYYTVGLAKFLDILGKQSTKDFTALLDAMEVNFGRLLEQGKLDTFGPALQNSAVTLLGKMNVLPPSTLQQQAKVGVVVVLKRRIFAAPKVNECFDIYDAMFTPKEGEALFESLEKTLEFPDGEQNATTVTGALLYAALAPYQRTKGSREHRKFISSVTEAIHSQYPNWRAAYDTLPNDNSSVMANHIDEVMGVPFINVTGDPLSNVPSRRHMGRDFKKAMHHFLTKHRKLIKHLDKHSHGKSKKHHHRHHKSESDSYEKKHKKDRKEQHGQHDKHNLHEFRTTRTHDPQRAVRVDRVGAHDQRGQRLPYAKVKQPIRKAGQPIVVRKAKEEDEIDTSASEAYFHPTENKNKLIPIAKIRKTAPKPKFFGTIDKKYLLNLAQKFKAKLENRNYINRRFMVTSSENKSDIQGKPSVKTKVHKIREASSYSDEEYALKTNLYDALRHGNRSFVQVQDNTQPGSFDEEMIIKRNLYS
ncbi:unnamed protein product [Chrysodeixis includens]|uniref:Uncharacterized protein n=1 Tax=Chrysodeixis includens TaxID=689277 RepID=A0A9N8L4Z5_CHRIL|nr:unnamed protein product [Chrysodeixis includens]